MCGNTVGLLAAEATDKENLYPHAAELIVGAVAFAVIFFFMWKWVLPAREHAARRAPAEDPGRDGEGRAGAPARPTRC